ncbi:MAG: M48 family metallopeptidase [Paludibacteraceae bacterium]
MKRIITHPVIGDIEFCTRRNVRGTHFRVTADRVCITTHPLLARSVFPLSDERVAWILNAQHELAHKTTTPAYNFAPHSTLKTNRFVVRFAPDDSLRTTFAARRTDNALTIAFRPECDFASSANQRKIRHLIAHFLKIEAQQILPARLQALADTYGFAFAQVRINSAQTRWGSCSAKRVINLSYNLMLLPDKLIDFVLVHELCHTREMNHGARFKQLMTNIFANYTALNAALKQYRPLQP